MAARARARSMIEADAPAATAPPTEGASASEIAEVSRCLVYCRMRPSFTRDFEDGGHELLTLQDRKVIVKDERTYEFDGTFKGDSRQDDVFRIVALPCIQHAFKGFCSALMCYGQTGTGKSFTMCCTKPGQEGIIPQAAITMFSMIRRDAARKYTVTAEFIQIYRDQLGDLMTEGGKDRVDIHFDATTGVTLPGCTSHELTSPEEFMSFYHEGDKRRVVTATAMNPESSRGHTALVVRINSIPVDDECGSRISGKITFIDLAGYERFSKTGISNSNAIMKDEAKTINASLLSLGHVVTSLSNGDKHIPWRNSKLTRLLQDSIGGRSRTTVILTVGPSSEHLHETTNTLQFGMRAMAVKVQAKVSTTVDFEKLAARLQAMLDEKNARISDLEIQAAANDAERQELLDRHRRDTEALHEAHAAELEAAKARGATADQLLEMSKQLNLEATTLKEQQEEEISYREDQHQKDMMEVFAEEQKRAQRDLVREKMARETAIVELEKRLEEARGGGNADLEHALRELAERDTKLVERATKIAALSARCEQLAQAVRNLGGEPSYDESDDDEPSALFVDISQVEDMKKRFGTEKDALSNQVADLRAALDETAAALAARTKEVDALQEAAIAREASFADLGAPKTPPPAVVEVKQVGLSEVEVAAIKTSMQSDIDFWKHRAVTLQAEVEEEKKKVAQHVAKAAQPKPDPTGQSRTIKELTMKLERLTSENEALKLTATENGSADPDKSVLALLAMKDDQLEHALQTMVDKERRIQDLQKQLQHAHKQNRSKSEGEASLADSFAGPVTNHSFSATMTNSEIVTQSTSGVNLDEFSAMLKAQRVKNTELQTKLMSDVPLDEKMKQLLASRDEQLAERDAEILRRGAMIESLQSALVRLERQLEEHGMVPTCKVDAETRALVDEKLNSQLKQLEQRQKELEDDNAKKAADKQKAAQLLQELNDARLKDAARFAQQEAELQRIKIEQAAKEQREAAELQRRRQELADAQELREQLQENTRQMMEAQARLALEREEAQSGGLFSRLKKRFAN